MIRKTIRLMLGILFLIAILAACSKPTRVATQLPLLTDTQALQSKTQPPPTETSVPPKPTQPKLIVKPGLVTGKVDVGGRNLYILCMGEGSPTVIFEAGWGSDYSTWAGALAEVSKHTMACVYDRAGLNKSDPATTFPRTSQDMVNDLHALLTNTPIPGPYIMVGHSLGGFNIRLYTDQYPQDVVGLVFVDSAHPDVDGRFCTALPTESPNEDPSFKQAREDCQATPVNVTDWTQVTEGLDLTASADQVRATGSFGDLPLVVLAAQYSLTGQAGTAQGLWGEIYSQVQQELAAQSSQGQYFVVENASHFDIPGRQAVSDAIIMMVDTLRRK